MTEDVSVSDSSTVNFQGNCGENSSGVNSATSVGMQPGQSATVNGSPPSNCVVGNDSATVFGIELVYNSGYYDYQIQIDAQGPNSMFGGSFYLGFQDQSGDVYYISIYSSRRENHTLSYDSDSPNIVAIFWSDESFSIDNAEAKQRNGKSSFQVISPARPDAKDAG